jgi:AcrR family transcriptional regulator
MSRSARTPRYQEKREAILSAAALLFNEHGLRGATLAHIAAQVGLATNSVTYYYRKKEDLATACLLRSIAAFDAVAEAASTAAAVADRLSDFFRGHAQLRADIVTRQHAPLIFFNDIRALPAPQTAEVFAAYNAMFKRVRALLQGAESAAWSRDELNARTHIVLSVANWMGPFLDRYEQPEYTRAAERIADIVVRGIAGRGARWSPPPDEAWRRAGDTDTTSDAFLRAATALVNEQGYRGASIDRISARLNLTKGSFYHHHDNKLDLITACFERSFTVMREALLRAEDGAGSGWARACAAASALVRFQFSEGGPLLRVSATSALPDAAHRDHVRSTLGRLAERMNSVVVDGMADGSVRPLDPAIASQALIAIVNAAAELHRWVPGVQAAPGVALYVRPAFEGVLCPAAGASSAKRGGTHSAAASASVG